MSTRSSGTVVHRRQNKPTFNSFSDRTACAEYRESCAVRTCTVTASFSLPTVCTKHPCTLEYTIHVDDTNSSTNSALIRPTHMARYLDFTWIEISKKIPRTMSWTRIWTKIRGEKIRVTISERFSGIFRRNPSKGEVTRFFSRVTPVP